MRSPSSAQQKVFYSAGNLANGVYNGLNSAILGLYLSSFTANPLIISYLSNTRTVEGVVIQPLVGRWSDRLSSPLGRRRPFILFGIPISVLFLCLIPLAGHARHEWALPLIALSVVLFSITWNLAGDPYQALMVDITPERERSVFNAVLSVVALIGQVGILLYAGFASLKKNNIPDLVFYVAAGFLLVSYALVFVGVREPSTARSEAVREEAIPFRVYLAELQTFQEARKLLVSIFFFWTGLNAVLPLLTTYTRTVMHVNDAAALHIFLVMILSSALAAYPSGRLGARYGNRPFIAIGMAMLIVAAVLGTVAPSYAWLFPVAVLAGVGFAPTTSLTYPYLAQLVPGGKMGVFTGLQAAFTSIAVPLSGALAALLIHWFGYRSIFVMLAVMMLAGIPLLLAIDEPAARRQIALVDRNERISQVVSAPVL